MSEREFAYRVCAMQQNRVTFVNGEWQGSIAPTADNPNLALNSCPTIWDYLESAGQEGWELVSALTQRVDEAQMQTLFLKQEKE